MGREMNVYFAARFLRLPELLTYKAELEADGITVTSRWLLGGHEWVGAPEEDLPVGKLARYAQEDLADLMAANVVVCFTEPPRSGPARGGRHVEMGYALAKGKPVIAVGHRENVFYCLPQVLFAADWAFAKIALIAIARSGIFARSEVLEGGGKSW